MAVINFDEQQLIGCSASHDIDILRWLCGEEVSEVSAVANSSRGGSTVTVVLTLTTPSGVVGVMELLRGPGLHYDIGCDIVASCGALTLGSPPPTDDWMQRFHGAYRAQDAGWLDAVAARTSTGGATAYDGYPTNAVIDAALGALADGRTRPVRQEPEG